MRRKSNRFTRKKSADKVSSWRLGRGGRYGKGDWAVSWFEDGLGQVNAITTKAPSSPSCLSSYFLCHRCFQDAEDKEPVVTFCGHVFCWSCLYDWINSKGTNRLRGACPSCEASVDLCPRTKNVCPIYYVEGPQAFPPNNLEVNDSDPEIDSKGKSEIKQVNSTDSEINSKGKNEIEEVNGSDSEIDGKGKIKIEAEMDGKKKSITKVEINSKGKCQTTDHRDWKNQSDDDIISNSEIMKERLKKFINVDPSKRPPDKRPYLRASFINFGVQDGRAIESEIFHHMQYLFRSWKSSIAESNDIVEKILSLVEELPLQLVNIHELAAQAVTDSHSGLPVKTTRPRILPSFLGIKEVNGSLNPSFCSSDSHYFSCNVCHGDTTSRKPIITYCGHVYCQSCFHDRILRRRPRECLVCRSAVDASTACPISCGGQAGEKQNRKTGEWQDAILVLNPIAVQRQILSMVYDLDHEFTVHTESFHDTILKLLRCVDDFCAGMEKHDGLNRHISYKSTVRVHQHFPKDDVRQLSVKTNIKGANITSRAIQVIQSEPAMTDASSSSGSKFICGCCHTHALNDPVVTYCTHLFCWPCLYLDIKVNGTHDEDGSLYGPCPVCKTDNIVFASTSTKLTVIPLCKGPESNSQENQKIEEECSTRVPPPTAKRLSIQELRKMRVCVNRTVCKIKRLINDLQLKMVGMENIISSSYGRVRKQRHKLLLGLVDGWRWALLGYRMPGVVGTDNAETQINGLSKYWVDVVHVDSACLLLNSKEVLGYNQVEFLTS